MLVDELLARTSHRSRFWFNRTKIKARSCTATPRHAASSPGMQLHTAVSDLRPFSPTSEACGGILSLLLCLPKQGFALQIRLVTPRPRQCLQTLWPLAKGADDIDANTPEKGPMATDLMKLSKKKTCLFWSSLSPAWRAITGTQRLLGLAAVLSLAAQILLMCSQLRAVLSLGTCGLGLGLSLLSLADDDKCPRP